MSYFVVPNNVYLVPSQILIIPSILLNLICKDFEPIKVLYKMSNRIFSCDFSSIKISRLKSSNLIVSLK